MESYIKTALQSVPLPPEFSFRRPSESDLKAVTQLIIDANPEQQGLSVFSEDELLADWQRPGFNLAEDAWVVFSPDGPGGLEKIVGYEDLHNRASHAHLDGDGYVHPDYRGLGIGTVLLRILEGRARQHLEQAEPRLRVSIRNGLSLLDSDGCCLHENEGYLAVRYFYHMSIRLSGKHEPGQWPEGIELCPFEPGKHDQVVFAAFEDAFRDHWGFTPWNYETWRKTRMLDEEGFDPSLWFLVWDGDDLVGGSLSRLRQGAGWVSQLAVRQPWRRKGLGWALLNHTFAEFYQRGVPQVELSVDAANLTGATRLYESAGMRVARQFVVYEKELRVGEDLVE